MAIKDELKNGGRPGLRKPKGAAGITQSGLHITAPSVNDVKAFMRDPVKPVAQMSRRSAPPAQVPTAVAKTPLAKKPDYYTRENSPTMGWQERIARNKMLDENYQAELASDTSRRNVDVGEAGALKRTQLSNQNALQLRDRIEGGLNTRQESEQTFEKGQQEARFGQQSRILDSNQVHEQSMQTKRFDWQTERDAKIDEYNTAARREQGAQAALENNNIRDQSQAKAYQDFGPGGVQGITGSPSKPKDLKMFEPEKDAMGNVIRPGGYFDPGTGEKTYDNLEDYDDAAKITILEEILKTAKARQALR